MWVDQQLATDLRCQLPTGQGASRAAAAPTGLMMMLAGKKKETTHCRQVQISKLPESRVGVGLVNLGRGVVGVAEVAATSPLEGLIFPGDIIQLGATSASAGVSSTRCPTPAGGTPDANALSAAFFAASDLCLTVETPPLLAEAQSIFLHSSELGDTLELGIQVEKDTATGRARVARLKPDSIAASAVGCDALAPGDLIVAVSEGGTLHETDNASQVAARLKAYQGGAVELRVVRSPGSQSSTRPSSASRASFSPAGYVPSPPSLPEPAFGLAPPAYTSAVSAPPPYANVM